MRVIKETSDTFYSIWIWLRNWLDFLPLEISFNDLVNEIHVLIQSSNSIPWLCCAIFIFLSHFLHFSKKFIMKRLCGNFFETDNKVNADAFFAQQWIHSQMFGAQIHVDGIVSEEFARQHFYCEQFAFLRNFYHFNVHFYCLWWSRKKSVAFFGDEWILPRSCMPFEQCFDKSDAIEFTLQVQVHQSTHALPLMLLNNEWPNAAANKFRSRDGREKFVNIICYENRQLE